MALIFAFLGGGCAETMPYPDHWEPLPRPVVDDCTPFQGRYNNWSEYYVMYGNPRADSLTEYFLSESERKKWSDVTQVELSLPSTAELILTGWSDEEKRLTHTVDQTSFSCDHGRLIVGKTGGVFREGTYGVESATITFSSAKGHLIAEVVTDAVGGYGIFPFAVKETKWTRFARSSTASQDDRNGRVTCKPLSTADIAAGRKPEVGERVRVPDGGYFECRDTGLWERLE